MLQMCMRLTVGLCVQLTPYLGLKLQGVVRATIVRGQLVYRDGRFSPEPLGKHLLIPSADKRGLAVKQNKE